MSESARHVVDITWGAWIEVLHDDATTNRAEQRSQRADSAHGLELGVVTEGGRLKHTIGVSHSCVGDQMEDRV